MLDSNIMTADDSFSSSRSSETETSEALSEASINTLDVSHMLFSRDFDHMPMVFVRLTQKDKRGNHHLVWQGFGDWCRQEGSTSCVLSLADKIELVDSAELKQLFSWMSEDIQSVKQLKRHHRRITSVVENLTLTLFCEGNTVTAEGGFDRKLRDDGDGIHCHLDLHRKARSRAPSVVDTRLRLGAGTMDIIVTPRFEASFTQKHVQLTP